jgi:hypothetical protein
VKNYIKNVIGYSSAVLIVAGPASGWLYLASLSALPAFGIEPIGYLPMLALVASFVGAIVLTRIALVVRVGPS